MENSYRSNQANHPSAFCLQFLQTLDLIKHMTTKLQIHVGILNFIDEKQLEIKSRESSACNCFLFPKSEIFVGCYQTYEDKTTNAHRNFEFCQWRTATDQIRRTIRLLSVFNFYKRWMLSNT